MRAVTLPVPGAELALIAVPASRPAPTVVIRTPYGMRNHLAEAEGWARRGFSCVVGDVRGRFESTGDFEPYKHERADSAAVVDWVVRQSFCDGGVLLAGGSYAAYCAVAGALARPLHVRGVIAAVPALGPGETVREPGGAARLACRVGWWTEHGGTSKPRDPFTPGEDLLAQLPIRDFLPDIRGWAEAWTAPRREPALWSEIERTGVPLLAVGGLADPFAADTVELARSWGGPTRLLLGPWGHEMDTTEALGKIGSIYVKWAQAIDQLSGHKELIAVTSDGQWRPMAKAQRRIALTVEKGAFVANPDRPYPAHREGNYAVLRAPVPAGEIRGPFAVELSVTTDSRDADWVVHAWLDNVHLGHGIRRIRNGVDRFTVDCTPAGAVVPDGAELKIEVAGHNWPRHARNPHTGEDPFTATTLLPSSRTVVNATLVLPWAAGSADRVLVEEIAA